MSKPIPITTILKFNTTLQRYKKVAEGNVNFSNGKRNPKGTPLFGAYPPEVRKLAWEHLSYLCIKHKARLQADRKFFGPLVATATRLALDELGITQISRKGFHRMRTINYLKYRIGIRDKHPVNRLAESEKRRRSGSPATNLP